MSSHEFRMQLHLSVRAATLCWVLWGVAVPIAHTQESPAPPAPHTSPVLPGTHVAPSPTPQRLGIVLHINGPATVKQNRCPASRFAIKYSVLNNTTELANGTLRATFNGVSLAPVGSAKLNNVPPGKAVSGAFTACCPSSGSFTASIDYRDNPSTTQNKIIGAPYYASDSLKISCTTIQ
jgi:hypothetical protein